MDLSFVLTVASVTQVVILLCVWRCVAGISKCVGPLAGMLGHTADGIWKLHEMFMKWGQLHYGKTIKSVEKMSGPEDDLR